MSPTTPKVKIRITRINKYISGITFAEIVPAKSIAHLIVILAGIIPAMRVPCLTEVHVVVIPAMRVPF